MQGQATMLRDSFHFMNSTVATSIVGESEPEKDAVEFKINLNTVIQCLSIFGMQMLSPHRCGWTTTTGQMNFD